MQQIKGTDGNTFSCIVQGQQKIVHECCSKLHPSRSRLELSEVSEAMKSTVRFVWWSEVAAAPRSNKRYYKRAIVLAHLFACIQYRSHNVALEFRVSCRKTGMVSNLFTDRFSQLWTKVHDIHCNATRLHVLLNPETRLHVPYSTTRSYISARLFGASRNAVLTSSLFYIGIVFIGSEIANKASKLYSNYIKTYISSLIVSFHLLKELSETDEPTLKAFLWSTTSKF